MLVAILRLNMVLLIVDDAVEVYVDRSLALSVIDPHDREMFLACGTALYNLPIAMRPFGYEDQIQIFPTTPILTSWPGSGSASSECPLSTMGQRVAMDTLGEFIAYAQRQRREISVQV